MGDIKFRYFYHPESDCLIKVQDGTDECRDYEEMIEVDELTREEFLIVASRLYKNDL